MAKNYSPEKQRIRAAITLISRQVWDTPQNRLMFAVFAQAAVDAVATDDAAESEMAAYYIEGAMPHLQQVGVNPSWARAKLQMAGLSLGSYNAGTLESGAQVSA